MMPLSRRQIFQDGLAASTLLLSERLWAKSGELEPSPDFALDQEPRFLAGIRPFREGSFRLEAESIDERLLVHNYGHGGAGITMSWGCAFEVLDLVRARHNGPKPAVAVLGAGAIGLTTALLLAEEGWPVTVYARGFCDETTSHVAGGQFAPSTVAWDAASFEGATRFERILRRSFRRHESHLGQGFGVHRRRNYTWNRSRNFEAIPRDVVGEPQIFERLPFAFHTARPGFCYQTLLIEPPIFLRRLELELRLRGARFIQKSFTSEDEVCALPFPILINCMGLGAGRVFADSAVVPVRGQLVMLKPQPELSYLYGGQGYIFPRSDGVVVGGSYETGVMEPVADPAMCAEILAYAKAPFVGNWQRTLHTPAWLETR